MAHEFTEVKRLPGIEDSWNGFCIQPDGSMAFFYDYDEKSFLQIDVTTGEKTKIKTMLTEEIASHPFVDLVAIIRSSKLYIVGLAYGEESEKHETRNTLVVSFYFNKDASTISAVDHKHSTFQTFPYLYRDEHKKLYLLSHDASNTYGAALIDVDDNGKLTIETLFSATRSMNYACCATFVYSGSFYFIPEEEDNKAKLLKLPFNNENFIEIDVENDIDNWSTSIERLSRPQVIDDDIYFYTYDVGMQTGYFLNFDLKALSCRRLAIKMSEHVIGEYWPSLKSDELGLLYVHGNCRLESCKDGAHIYAMKTETAGQINQPPKVQGSQTGQSEGII